MNGLMWVRMGGVAAPQTPEFFHLPPHLPPDRLLVVHRHDDIHMNPVSMRVDPFPEIDVEPDADGAVVLRIFGGRRGGPLAHHEAGARDDAALGAIDNPPVHARTEAEIISIDNQSLQSGSVVDHRFYNPASLIRFAKTFSAAKNSEAMSRAARQLPS